MEGYVVRHGSAHDIQSVGSGRIEVGLSRAVAVASERIALAGAQSLGNFLSVEVWRAWECVDSVVVYDVA